MAVAAASAAVMSPGTELCGEEDVQRLLPQVKISEIARVLDAPESTVSVRLKRAREQLKKRLEGWYADGK